MLKSLKFVQGSIAKKDLVPSLRHFIIRNGFVQGYNGVISLCSPIPFDLECQPDANSLIKAISNCEDEISLTLTKGGKLSIKSGPYKALINCFPEEVVNIRPEGDNLKVDGEKFLDVCKKLEQVIGDDASRKWSNGILFLGNSAFATNNVILTEYWTGFNIHRPINIPRVAVKEINRINKPVEKIMIADNSATFFFEGDRWLRTQVLEVNWPDLTKIINVDIVQESLIDEKMFKALEKIKPFLDKSGRVYLRDGKISSHNNDEEGSSFELEGFTAKGCYQAHMLELLQGISKTIDWTRYPKPCPFQDGNLRGVIVGMRTE